MKRLEFESEVTEKGVLIIPPELGRLVAGHRGVRVSLRLPDDSGESQPVTPEASGIMSTFGVCKGDESLTEIFAQIDQKRHNYQGREVDLT